MTSACPRPAATHFDSFTEARKHFRTILDNAQAGRVTSVQRDRQRFAVVAADRLVGALVRLRPAEAVVSAERGGWSVVLPGLPVHGDGDSMDEAVDDLLEALRDYAAD